ncbi:MAG: DNA polymerase III subunit delta [Clostridia bacterium]|nr:DNA polymerase III subunit delta [Clostridia bacterium]
MSIDILKDDIKNKRIKNLYLFYGPEEYLKKYYLESLEKEILSDDMKALNKIVLEGKADIKRISEACETMPVFSERKIVIVRNSGLLKAKKKQDDEGKGKQGDDSLVSYLQNLPEYTCLVFFEEEIDKRVKVIDIIKKNGLIVEFVFQKPVELVKWVSKVFKTYKKEIDPVLASRMVENCEQGMTEILNEINKVVLYLGDRQRVTNDDIEKICTKSIKGRIFDLTDAIAEKNTAKALKLLNDMIILKEPIPKILFMITRQLRQVLEMKLLNNEGLNSGQAATKMGITPYAAGKISKQTRVFDVENLKGAIEESLDMDLAIKTGKIDERMAVELLISKLSK